MNNHEVVATGWHLWALGMVLIFPGIVTAYRPVEWTGALLALAGFAYVLVGVRRMVRDFDAHAAIFYYVLDVSKYEELHSENARSVTSNKRT